MENRSKQMQKIKEILNEDLCIEIKTENMNENHEDKQQHQDKEQNEENKIKRCIAYNNKNRRCRAKIRNNEMFCCDTHKPLNMELIDGCFICYEKIENVYDLYYFKCKHILHKSCYNEWVNHQDNTYEKSICMICRNEVLKKPVRTRFRTLGVLNKVEYSRIQHIFDIFNNNNLTNSSNNQILPITYTEGGIPLYSL
jgi:hypothetical protein